MHLKYTHILFFGLILLSSFTLIKQSETALDIKLLTAQTEFKVGSDIELKFSVSQNAKPLLYCSNSYGSTVIDPIIENNVVKYKIPPNINSKIGIVNWKLIKNNSTMLSGQFHLNPKQEVATMETYIGPPSIEAGGIDFTMLVVIPTDSLDNPLAENTLVTAKHQFLSTEDNEAIFTKNLISYKNIYSQKESGRMLVSSESLTVNSKEFTVTVFPAIPADFTVLAKRPHDYADGNQITIFETSIIKDKQGNIVIDGTYVNFFVTNEKGNVLKTSGTTINGTAIAKMIHPDYETKWTIKAYVEGMAESNTIAIDYKKVIHDFEVDFSKNNRAITIGPLQSFMKQMIPDGLQVKLLVYKNDKLIEALSKTTIDGYVLFNLKSDLFKNDKYNIVIKTAGIEKKYNSKALW
ncbi:hypothetical protein [uncultured Lacinutrix sp.]|uniref:hypothetical protein n=1 Tax=uncultured Lacinutrix sp. TaxID=574032 RepID=UPI002630881E|nr:hypothetical protein [uncultured Lacinutrix sp.]